MYCRNCGHQTDDRAAVCPSCGGSPTQGAAYCQNCGKATQPVAVVCLSCGAALASGWAEIRRFADKKIPAGICGILLGAFGIHKFVLGYNVAGMIMLLITVCTCGWGWIPMHLIGLIEGILYLVKSDEEFVNTYVKNKRSWF